MASQVATRCCNKTYDVLTILVSMADVATDIIVLIDFYNKDRMVFFGISLAILILAQCSYAMVCAIRFDTIDNWEPYNACLGFCCILPFGTLVAFCIYCASHEAGWRRFRDFLDRCHLDTNSSMFSIRDRDNKLVKWIKTKLERHIGFILEAAIEAFPQSLLQIIAIVYYQEATYITIISILLSMFSVISKSLILSQGIEKLTFIWTWLCVVTDFFGIFFTLTWVFYSHDSIHGEFLGYFNIFGQIWMYKLMISTLLPVGLALCMFFGFAYWFMYLALLCKTTEDIDYRCGWSCLWLTLSPIVALLCAFGTCLGFEVFCFSIFAMCVFIFGTDRIADSRSKHTSKLVTFMLDFISRGNDKRLRILSINKGMHWVQNINPKLSIFIDRTLDVDGYEGLQKITYSDIRQNCNNPKIAELFPSLFEEIMDEWKGMKRDLGSHSDMVDTVGAVIGFFIFTLLFFWVIPVLLLSKILQILYPWIIVIYLTWNNLLFTNQIDLFQMVMLTITIALQLVILFLGIPISRIHKYLWHIQPGTAHAQWKKVNVDRLIHSTQKFYDDVCWYPQVELIVRNSFIGCDIANIILDYCKSFQLDNDSLL
eukprot:184067_1